MLTSVANGMAVTSEWKMMAACRGPRASLFYAPTHTERKGIRIARERQAKSVCNTCPVRSVCLEHALDHDERHGVWGGLTESERATLIARR